MPSRRVKRAPISRRGLPPALKRDPRKQGADCNACPLKTSISVYPSIPKRKYTLAILGEAPGKQEIKQGAFFVGATGKELQNACKTNRIDFDRVYTSNAVLCRPEQPLDPDEWQQAVKCCRPRLQKDLQRANVSTAIVLGKQALRSTTGKASIRDWMGAPLQGSIKDNLQVLGTYHPAFCMRAPDNWVVFGRHFAYACALATGRLKPFKWPKLFVQPDTDMLKALDRIHDDTVDGVCGIDVETAGAATSRLTAIGVASTSEAVSCPWPPENFTTYVTAKAIRTRIRSILTDPDVQKAAHNGIHDIHAIKHNERIEVAGYCWDTLIMHATAAPTLPHSLSFVCCVEFPGMPRWKTEHGDRGDYRGLEKWERALDTPESRVAHCVYNAQDSIVLPWLVDSLHDQLTHDTHNGMEIYDGYFERSLIAARMQKRGARVNTKALGKHQRSLSTRRGIALQKLRKVARDCGYEHWQVLNPQSDPQIKSLFFDFLQIKPVEYSEKTGKPSLSEKALHHYITNLDNPKAVMLSRALLNFRKPQKLLSTYVKRMDPKHPKSYCRSGYIHPQANVTGAKTMRWAYKAPNMQNIPASKFKAGKLVSPGMRDLIIARDGFWILEADYSQLELRIIALFSGDEQLLSWYQKGIDVHTENAKLLFGVASPDKAQRDLAKRFVYGINYGGNEQTIWQSLVVDFEDLTLDTVAILKRKWYGLHPDIKRWQTKTIKAAKDSDYVELPLSGRHIHFHGMVEPTKPPNYKIQGTAANIIDRAIVGVADSIDWKSEALLFQVHDALVCETRHPARTAAKLKKYMEQDVILDGQRCKFPIDFKIGRNWGECVSCDTINDVRKVAA